MRKCLFLLLLTTAFVQTASGQRLLGAATGNFNAMNSLYLNPAYLAGCNEKFTVSLFSLNLGVDNNLGKLGSIGSIGKTTNSNDSGAQNIFKITNSGKFSMMVPAVEIRGPGVLYRINNRHTLALTTRLRAFNEFNNFDRSLYDLVTNPKSAASQNSEVTSSNFNWTAHVWSEIGLSYGTVIVDQDKFQLKGGVSLRYLIGIGYIGMKGKNLNVNYRSGNDTVRATNSDIEFGSNAQGLSDALTNGVSTNKLFGGPSAGKGFGGDLGLVFMYRPESDKWEEKGYKLALSVAVTDIGSITYSNSYNVNVTGNGTLTGDGLSKNIKDYQDFRNYIASQGYALDTGKRPTNVYLPTALVVGADYHVYKWVYVNGTIIANMANEHNFGSVYYSQFTVTPRFDTKLISFGLPLTFNMLTHNMRIGSGIRVSGFFIGSDDMMALFSSNQYGFNFYMGGMIPIYRKPVSKIPID